MFNIFNSKLHPFMDADSDVGGGTVTPQTGTEGTQTGEQTGSETGTEGTQETQGSEETSGGTEAAAQTKQTPEQNAAFAELRRSKEAAERRANEVEAQRKRDHEVAKKYGKDYGIYSDADVAERYGVSHGIRTVAEFESALQREEYREKGVDPDLIDKIVENHPAIKAAKAQHGQAIIKSEIDEFSNEYPDLKVKSIKDMQKLPNFDAIKEKAYRGMTLLEAYEAVNRAELRQKAKEQGAQQTIRNIGSKAHLGTEKSGNSQQGKEVEVSAEKMRVWKAMGYTEAQARQKEAKYLKKK